MVKAILPRICVASLMSCLKPSFFSEDVILFVGLCIRQTLKSPVIKVGLERSIMFVIDFDVSMRLFDLDR